MDKYESIISLLDSNLDDLAIKLFTETELKILDNLNTAIFISYDTELPANCSGYWIDFISTTIVKNINLKLDYKVESETVKMFISNLRNCGLLSIYTVNNTKNLSSAQVITELNLDLSDLINKYKTTIFE